MDLQHDVLRVALLLLFEYWRKMSGYKGSPVKISQRGHVATPRVPSIMPPEPEAQLFAPEAHDAIADRPLTKYRSFILRLHIALALMHRRGDFEGKDEITERDGWISEVIAVTRSGRYGLRDIWDRRSHRHGHQSAHP